jgi:hypothetical protein
MLDAGCWMLWAYEHQSQSRELFSIGAADGNQWLGSNPWEIHQSAEHPEGMRV